MRSDKSVYEGEYYQNKMEGHGKYSWDNGRLYEGDFVNNMMEGSGTFAYADGR